MWHVVDGPGSHSVFIHILMAIAVINNWHLYFKSYLPNKVQFSKHKHFNYNVYVTMGYIHVCIEGTI